MVSNIIFELKGLRTYEAVDIKALQKLSVELAKKIERGGTLLLHGDVGAGKTLVCKFIIDFLCGCEAVSPTFNILLTYKALSGITVYHYDLYRVKAAYELHERGFEHSLEEGITLIEWPEIALSKIPKDAIHLEIKPCKDDNLRKIYIRNLDR